MDDNLSAAMLDRLMFVLLERDIPNLNEIRGRFTAILHDYIVGPKEEAMVVYTEGKNEYYIKRFLLAKAVAGCTKRESKREEAVKFFLAFANADCEHIAIKNPVGYMNTNYRKPEQIIHPYFFAKCETDSENYVQKRTCLWLKNLPILKRTTDLQKPEPKYYCQGGKCNGKAIGWCEGISGTTGGQAGRAKARSKTFPGIAKAMAEQWGREKSED